MKTSILYATIFGLAVALGVSLMFNFNVFPQKDIVKDEMPLDSTEVVQTSKSEIIFELSELNMEMEYHWDLQKGMALLNFSFVVENVSNMPQMLYADNLGLWDIDNCYYSASKTYNSRLNPLLFSEALNPNTKKRLALVFEVPQDKLYCAGYADNIQPFGVHHFKDNCRDIQCSYNSFEEMVSISEDMANNLAKYKIPKTKYEELEVETLKIN